MSRAAEQIVTTPKDVRSDVRMCLGCDTTDGKNILIQVRLDSNLQPPQQPTTTQTEAASTDQSQADK